jgi:hypothetical protein
VRILHKGLFGSADSGFNPADWALSDPWANLSPSDLGKGAGPSSRETAAVGDLGTIASLSRGGSTGTVSGSSGATPTPTQVTTPGSGLVFNLDWDSSVSSAPSGFMNDIIAAVRFIESQISNAVTINLDVGYNEINGNSLSSGALGESETNIVSVSYSQLVAALKATASTDSTDASLLASLPATSPVSGTYWTTFAQAKALGLLAANNSGLDGAIGFGTSSEFTYGDTNTSGTVAASTYDFFATAVHELTESMGRLLLVGGSINGKPGYSLMDLLHYSAPGTHDFSQSTPGYFSVNGGQTNLGNFNTIAGGDAGDWDSSVTNNSFDAYATPGVIEVVASNDLTEMDAIGWNPTSTTSSPPPPPPPPPTGVSVIASTASLGAIQSTNGLVANKVLATVAEVGGQSGDTFTYTLGGPGPSSFTLTGSGTLSTGATSVAGATNGKVYALTLTANDTTEGVSSAPSAFDVVVGGGGKDTVSVKTLIGASAAATPTFIYGLGGNDTLDGTGMTSKLWFVGGAGADTMTGGSGGNDYLYGAVGDSTASAMDIITNFHAVTDFIDLTGIGTTKLTYVGNFSGSRLAAHSIGYQVSGGSTQLYVNTTFGSEGLTAINMKISLVGSIALTSTNILHS